MGRLSTRIELAHLAFNPDSARAFGRIWKLAYAALPAGRAELQVFADSAEAEEGGWAGYGAPAGHAATLLLRGVGSSATLEQDGLRILVRFAGLGERRVTYPDGSTETVPVRRFTLTRLG